MSDQKTPWIQGPYELDWECGAIYVAGTNTPVAFLPARLNGTWHGKATGTLLAESHAMADLLRSACPILADTDEGCQLASDVRALLDRIQSA